MLNYIEFLNINVKIAAVIVSVFLVIQLVGEILEFKGKVVPEFLKIRKYFARKKKEREILTKLPDILSVATNVLKSFDEHYSADNIKKREQWINDVNYKLNENDKCIRELGEKLDKNNQDTLSLLIDSKRNTIINFASKCIDNKSPATREEFNRVLRLYNEYEKIIEENGLTNGEVDIAVRIIKESYENRMKTHSFVENLRGYEL